MWMALAYGGFLVGSYVYHRLTAEHPPKPRPESQIEIPRQDDGAAPMLIYGRCRVRQPLIAWLSSPIATSAAEVEGVTVAWQYSMDMLMVVGIPFENAAVRFYGMWIGEMQLRLFEGEALQNIGVPAPGVGYTLVNTSDPLAEQQGYIGDLVDVFDGSASQQLVNPTTPFASTSNAGTKMIAAGVSGAEIPGFRGYVSVLHYRGGGLQWGIGTSPNLGAYSYEVSSHPNDSDAFNVGYEANPAKVLRDLLTGSFGKLNLASSLIDGDSFGNAKIRLQEEGNGYSRAIESADAGEIIREILEQIDGLLYENPTTGKIHIKLIRDDYEWSSLIGVTTENCDELQNFAAGGFEGVVNKVRVVFTDRSNGYREGSASAHSQAAAAGQDGEVREVVLNYPGVCTHALAAEIAARELAARSRPIAKCRAIVDRTFYQTMPGDPVRVTWPEYGIDGRVFRVAAVNRGTLENGKIALDLIEDFFYVWRNVLIPGHPIEAFPDLADLIED